MYGGAGTALNSGVTIEIGGGAFTCDLTEGLDRVAYVLVKKLTVSPT